MSQDDEWSICPYAVGLLLDVPDEELAQALSGVYRAAERTAHRMGLPMKLEAARAVMAVYIQYAANEARALDAWPELAYWLERAAVICVADIGMDIAGQSQRR